MQTEFEFTLPVGFVDSEGTRHQQGVMRMATALDEIAPMRDPRVRNNQAYLAIILLARVITRLGTITNISTITVENLFAADLAFLQAFYKQINETGKSILGCNCPNCNTEFEIDLAALGG